MTGCLKKAYPRILDPTSWLPHPWTKLTQPRTDLLEAFGTRAFVLLPSTEYITVGCGGNRPCVAPEKEQRARSTREGASESPFSFIFLYISFPTVPEEEARSLAGSVRARIASIFAACGKCMCTDSESKESRGEAKVWST